MSHQVFVDEFLALFLLDAAVNPQLGLQVREDALQTVVCVWQAQLRMVVESPQQRHVALDAHRQALPHPRAGTGRVTGTTRTGQPNHQDGQGELCRDVRGMVRAEQGCRERAFP